MIELRSIHISTILKDACYTDAVFILVNQCCVYIIYLYIYISSSKREIQRFLWIKVPKFKKNKWSASFHSNYTNKPSTYIYTYTAFQPYPYRIVILNINIHTCTRMYINLRILKSRTIPAASLLFNHFHQRAKRVEFLPVCRLNGAFWSSKSKSSCQIWPKSYSNNASSLFHT